MQTNPQAKSEALRTSGMLAKLYTYSLLGIQAMPVEVEVDVSPRAMPKTILVGLPEAAVRESTHRVERALVNSGFMRPADRVVINLRPPSCQNRPLRSICPSVWEFWLAAARCRPTA